MVIRKIEWVFFAFFGVLTFCGLTKLKRDNRACFSDHVDDLHECLDSGFRRPDMGWPRVLDSHAVDSGLSSRPQPGACAFQYQSCLRHTLSAPLPPSFFCTSRSP